jgi:hypothetical protein
MSVNTESRSDSFVVKLIVGAVVLGIGIVIVSSVFGAVVAAENPGSLKLDNGQQTFGLFGQKQVEAVKDTSGRAAAFGGSGAVVVNNGIGFLNATGENETGTATLATHAAVDDPSRTQVIYQLGQEYQLSYNGSSQQYQLYYFDEETRDSYIVRVNASATPTKLSPIFFSRDGETLTLRTTTNSSAIQTTGDSFVALPTDAGLDGRIEETRVVNTILTSSQRTSYVNDPIDPVAVGNRESRLMFDKTGESVAVDFRANASARLTGDATRGSGVAGQQLDEGVDFELSPPEDSRQTITALAGGKLEDMPRVFVAATNDFETLLDLVSVAFGIGGVVLIVTIAVKVISRVKVISS